MVFTSLIRPYFLGGGGIGGVPLGSHELRYQLWLRIKGFVPEIVGPKNRRALGCSPRIRVYRCLVLYGEIHVAPFRNSLRRDKLKKVFMICRYLFVVLLCFVFQVIFQPFLGEEYVFFCCSFTITVLYSRST